jgi:hypothetical protein
MLIDLLPTGYRLGLGFCGEESLLSPLPLSLARRAELHNALQRARVAGQCTEREMQQLTLAALRQYGSGSLDGNLLLLVAGQGASSGDWSEQLAAAALRRVQTLVITEQPEPTLHPLAKDESGRQFTMGNSLLALLMQQLGLGTGVLSQVVIAQDAAELTFHLDQEVEGFVLMAERALPSAINLTSPEGGLVDLQQQAALGSCLITPSYTCLHFDQESLATELGWSGEWRMTVPSQASIALWLVDPVRVDGQVQVERGARMVTASVWRGGERLDKTELGDGKVLLRDRSKLPLATLNDLGLNGDQQAGDGIFSTILPDYLHPLAGQVTLEVQGYIYRSLQVQLPAAQPLRSVESENREAAFYIALAMLVGTVGLIGLSRGAPPKWRFKHRSAAGYLHSLHKRQPSVYAGSGRGCALHLSAAAAKRHLRFRDDRDSGLSLEVLHPQPVTLVNGDQVFLRRQLQHGDVVQVGDDQILVEELAALRVGRRARS